MSSGRRKTMFTGIQAYQRSESPLTDRSDEKKVQSPLARTETKGKGTSDAGGMGRGQDRVSLSDAVQGARLRESLGLPISGKITKAMLEETQNTVRDTVNSHIQKVRDEVGIPEDAEISVRITEKGDIRVNSKSGGAWEIEKRLQEDTSFKNAFTSLSLHSRMQEISSRAGQRPDLFSDTSERPLSTIAREYTALRQGQDPLKSLVQQAQNLPSAFVLKHGGDSLAA